MKHLLNDISQDDKNSILEQHVGGIRIESDNFSKLLNKKRGNVNTFIIENEKTINEKTESITITPKQMKMLHDEGECKCGEVTLKFPSYKK
jgi:hypothetical protein|tara:strand:+ start:60 stop:332 length:273 start_codon:yes stop_codon:yes gene_type:complete